MLVVGGIEFKWFIEEIAAMFFVMGIVVGITVDKNLMYSKRIYDVGKGFSRHCNNNCISSSIL